MSVTQYIGARYVPLFADPDQWSSDRAYEPLTIVLHEGNSYTSKQAVPIGIDIQNNQFWALTGNYNAQVEAYRQEVQQFDGRITEVEELATQTRENLSEFEAQTEANLDEIESSVDDLVSADSINYIVSPEPYGAVKADGRTQGGCVVENDLYTITATDNTNVCVISKTNLTTGQTTYKTMPQSFYHGNCLTHDSGSRFFITDYATPEKIPGNWVLKTYDYNANSLVETRQLQTQMPLVIKEGDTLYGVWSQTTWDKEFYLCTLDENLQPAETIATITTPENADSRGFLPSGLAWIPELNMFVLSLYDADHNYFAFINPESGLIKFSENNAFGETQFLAAFNGQLIGGLNVRNFELTQKWQHIVLYSYRGGNGSRYYINNRTYQGITVYAGERSAALFFEDGSADFPFADGNIFMALASTNNVTINLTNDIYSLLFTAVTNYFGLNLNGHKIQNMSLTGRSITTRITGPGEIQLYASSSSNYGMILYNCATQITNDVIIKAPAGKASFRVRGGSISFHNGSVTQSDKAIKSQIYEGTVAHLAATNSELWNEIITVYGSFFNGEWNQGSSDKDLPIT